MTTEYTFAYRITPKDNYPIVQGKIYVQDYAAGVVQFQDVTRKAMNSQMSNNFKIIFDVIRETNHSGSDDYVNFPTHNRGWQIMISPKEGDNFEHNGWRNEFFETISELIGKILK